MYVALAKTWPHFCKHLQLQQNCGKLADDDGLPWYDFNSDTAVRKMKVLDDNAPYNYGVQFNIKNASKIECARVLRLLNCSYISIIHYYKDGVTSPLTINVLVPPEGSDWKKQLDYPNKQEVQDGTVRYITENHPHLLRPAYHYVLDEHNIEHDHTIAYTSNNIPVEYVWADIKGYAARPENQVVGRSASECYQLLHNKLFRNVSVNGNFKEPISMRTWFDHTNKEWEKWIVSDAKSGGPLSGSIDNLIGAPNEASVEWQDWLRKAGYGEPPEERYDMELDGAQGNEDLLEGEDNRDQIDYESD